MPNAFLMSHFPLPFVVKTPSLNEDVYLNLYQTKSKMETQQTSKAQLWTGRIMSGIVILFMLFDGIIKFTTPDEATIALINQLGFQADQMPLMGTLALISIIIYIIPKTSVLGALLLTAYFGGAISTHVRVDNPLFSHILFPVYLAILMWGGLWFRNPRLRQLLPIGA
jgi:hypothetical protein